MAFERPAPDLNKLITAWEAWEKGEEMPGRVLANLKTAGLAEILAELKASGWTPTAQLFVDAVAIKSFRVLHDGVKARVLRG